MLVVEGSVKQDLINSKRENGISNRQIYSGIAYELLRDVLGFTNKTLG